MIDLVEVFERAEIGPLTSETDYYMKRFVPEAERDHRPARHQVGQEHHHQRRRRPHRPRLPGGRRPARRGRRLLSRDQPRDGVHPRRDPDWPAASARPRRPSAKAASARSCAAVAPTRPTIARGCTSAAASTRPTNRSSWTRSRRWPRSTSSTRSACPRSCTPSWQGLRVRSPQEVLAACKTVRLPARASAARAAPACRSSTASRPLRSRPRCSRPATPTSACGRATGS